MIFSVCHEGIEWSFDFGPDSLTLTVKDLIQKFPLADWRLLMFRKQDFLNNHLARVPVTPNQEGTMEKRVEVLSSVGVQEMDTSEHQVSDLDDTELHWENDQLGVDTVFIPVIDTVVHQQRLTTWR